ncbi:unnamed protein product [Prorocentrum cordatum]|uniref:Ion transport domain-containing protein n=1 Tax=Prorocentrum cordatum TaxID=2364126 RepID=A0ABN9T426_9DINO|nr:unnamed protein product [Polarella glacialis]
MMRAKREAPPLAGEDLVVPDEPHVDERPAGHHLRGREGAVMSKLHAHGRMLEEILRRLPPAPGGEEGPRAHAGLRLAPPSPPPVGGPRGATGEEERAEPRSVGSMGSEEQRKGGPEGQGSCESEVVIRRDTLSSAGSDGYVSGAATGVRRRDSRSSIERAAATCKSAAASAVTPRNPNPVDFFHEEGEDVREGGGMPTYRFRATIRQIILMPIFECVFACLIIVNTIIMVIEEQYHGARVGYDIGFYTFYGSDIWADSTRNEAVFDILEIIFAVIFTVEVALRIVAMGFQYFRRPSEYFDLAVVILSDLSIVLNSSSTLDNIELLRLLRAVKLLRLLKLVRTIEGFDALHLMTTALESSAWALCWSVLLLLSIQTFVAMIATYLFRALYMKKGSLSDEDLEHLFEYWGTFTRSLLSLFELALANWPPICRWLAENLHEGFIVAALSYKLVMGMAVVGVINARWRVHAGDVQDCQHR